MHLRASTVGFHLACRASSPTFASPGPLRRLPGDRRRRAARPEAAGGDAAPPRRSAVRGDRAPEVGAHVRRPAPTKALWGAAGTGAPRRRSPRSGPGSGPGSPTSTSPGAACGADGSAAPLAAALTASSHLPSPSPAWAASQPPRTSGSLSRNHASLRYRAEGLTWLRVHRSSTPMSAARSRPAAVLQRSRSHLSPMQGPLRRRFDRNDSDAGGGFWLCAMFLPLTLRRVCASMSFS